MIIYLNGPINSGKTTVARLLVKNLSRGVHIEVDDLPHPPTLTLDQAIPLLLQDAAWLARTWVERGFSPVLSWPISPEHHQWLVGNLGNLKQPIHTYTLSPRLEVALNNRGGRELTPWERERIACHYAMGVARPPFGQIIDNSGLSPEQVAQRILDEVRSLSVAHPG
jgi:hypothetical protein